MNAACQNKSVGFSEKSETIDGIQQINSQRNGNQNESESKLGPKSFEPIGEHMRCPNCQTAGITKNAKFCHECGTPMSGPSWHKCTLRLALDHMKFRHIVDADKLPDSVPHPTEDRGIFAVLDDGSIIYILSDFQQGTHLENANEVQLREPAIWLWN